MIAYGRRWDDFVGLSARNALMGSVFLAPPLLCVMLGAYWIIFDADPPVSYSRVATYNVAMQPTTVFGRGETMLVMRESCILRDNTSLTYTRRFVSRSNQTVYFSLSSDVTFNKGCRTGYNDVLIPRFAEPGEYEYIVEVYYTNNPLVSGYVTLPIPRITIQ